MNQNRNRNRGSSSNPKNSTPSSTSSKRDHGNQGTSSKLGNAKDNSSHVVNSQQGDVNSGTSSHSHETPMINCSDEQNWPSPSNAKTSRSTRASTSLEAAVSQDGLDTISGSPCRPYGASYGTHPVSTGESFKHGTDQVADQNSRVHLKNVASQLGKTSINKENAHYRDAQTVSAVTSSNIEQARGTEYKSSDCSKYEMPRSITSPKRAYDKHSSDHTDDNGAKSIDICPEKHGVPKLKISLFEKNREKRKELERLKDDPRPTRLRPGMILLKNFISHADQVKIIKKCRELGLGSGGFYKPGYDDGAKLRLHMMCLGKNWDPQKRLYEEFRSVDGVKPPIIPEEFKKLVSDAIQASRQDDRVRNPNEAIPLMEPDICIVNFYTNTGKLGLHQDRDESPESIKKGLPVVSFSIGDSANFLYGDDREEGKAEKVELKSGDVLIFGGKSRLIFHGVPSIMQNSAPKFLADEANLRPGRLNLTFREY